MAALSVSNPSIRRLELITRCKGFEAIARAEDHEGVFITLTAPWFPVNCTEIAEGLGIKVHAEPIDDEFEGCLYIGDGLRAIIYNENILEVGRKNFTIAHELGHYSLHANNKNLKCSINDLNNFGDIPPHGEDIEREANLFAANLLMPGIDIGRQIKGVLIDLCLIERLSIRYGTSITATACRVVEKHNRPAAVVFLDSKGRVEWCWRNSYFDGFFLPRGRQIAVQFDDMQSNRLDFSEVGLEWSKFDLRYSSISMPYYGKKLMLITGH